MTALLEPSTALIDRVIAYRRDFHQHPELGFREHRTAGVVAARLTELGYDVHTGIAETGVVGVLRSDRPGKTIMLRADMDGLPVTEENALPFASTHEGRMHACGHDGHVAILLGAAEAIAERRADLAGTICVLFQPAEEMGGGGERMVREGVLERFGIERAYGLHLFSSHRTGLIGLCPGPFMASADSLDITIVGRGGHGAAPHLSVDPILVASEFVVAVQQVVSRQVDPLEPAVITIGSFHAGTAENVIPSRVHLRGTVRTLNGEVRDEMPERIERVLRGVCEAAGASYDYTYRRTYPVTANDREQTRYVEELARHVVGEASVEAVPQIMGSEDFSFYAQRVPACFFALGSSGGPDSSWPHHHARFDIDEAALATGVRMMAALAFDAPNNAP